MIALEAIQQIVAAKRQEEGERTLILPYPPSANRYWRHVTMRGRAVTLVSREAKAYREEVMHRAMLAKIMPIDGRVALHIDLYPARPKDWAKRSQARPDDWDDTVQCMDLGNCEKVLSDALNGIAWHDDKQIFRMSKQRMVPDEHGARVVVTFSPIITARTQESLL